jgi:hypothetical protein
VRVKSRKIAALSMLDNPACEHLRKIFAAKQRNSAQRTAKAE